MRKTDNWDYFTFTLLLILIAEKRQTYYIAMRQTTFWKWQD